MGSSVEVIGIEWRKGDLTRDGNLTLIKRWANHEDTLTKSLFLQFECLNLAEEFTHEWICVSSSTKIMRTQSASQSFTKVAFLEGLDLNDIYLFFKSIFS